MTMDPEKLKEYIENGYRLLDLRDEMSFEYGHINGSESFPLSELQDRKEELRGEKLLFICKRGEISETVAEEFRADGFEAESFVGGYLGWLMREAHSFEETEEEIKKEERKRIEQSLNKGRFRKEIWCKFTKAVNTYDLLQEGDKVAVCISGGKDSMLMAKLFQELKRHSRFPFEVEYLVMDPGYSPENRKIIENNLDRLGIEATIFESEIFDSVFEIEKNPCYLCARMRRGYLYSKAQELGCNKIALGHHYDDVIETILMGMLFGGQMQTMMPKLHSTNFEGMELIRPLYLVREESVKAWRDAFDLRFIQCACRFTDTCSTCGADKESASARKETKRLIREMKKNNPFVESNIFRSVENVNLNTIIAYKKDGEMHHFLDDYDTI